MWCASRSIHKSKGQQGSHCGVFVGLRKEVQFSGYEQSILLHQDLGFGPDVVDTRLRASWPSAVKQAIREKIRIETLSEEIASSVALTRAREKLIITERPGFAKGSGRLGRIGRFGRAEASRI